MNAAFKAKVSCVEGAIEFLHAVGFEQEEIEGEPFVVLGDDPAMALSLSVDDIEVYIYYIYIYT